MARLAPVPAFPRLRFGVHMAMPTFLSGRWASTFFFFLTSILLTCSPFYTFPLLGWCWGLSPGPLQLSKGFATDLYPNTGSVPGRQDGKFKNILGYILRRCLIIRLWQVRTVAPEGQATMTTVPEHHTSPQAY